MSALLSYLNGNDEYSDEDEHEIDEDLEGFMYDRNRKTEYTTESPTESTEETTQLPKRKKKKENQKTKQRIDLNPQEEEQEKEEKPVPFIFIPAPQKEKPRMRTAVTFQSQVRECYKMNAKTVTSGILERTRAAVCLHNNKLYIHGGFMVKELGSFYSYDIMNNTWTNEQQGLNEKIFAHDHLMFTIDNKSIVLILPESFCFLPLVKKERVSWKQLSVTKLRAQSCSMIRFRDSFYQFGGIRDGACVNTFVQYCTSSVSFHDCFIVDTSKTEITPEPRAHHSASFVRSYMYVYGGIGNEGRIHHDLWRFNFTTYMWEHLDVNGSIPPLLLYPRAEIEGNSKFMYVYGGTDDDNQLNNSLYRYDTEANEWQLAKISSGNGLLENKFVISPKLITAGNCMYILCGVNQESLPHGEMIMLEHASEEGSVPSLPLYLHEHFKKQISCDIVIRALSSDETIQYVDIKAHKCVLCVRCPHYFTHDVLQNAPFDDQLGLQVIQLDKYHASTVHAYLTFLYTGSIDVVLSGDQITEFLTISQELDGGQHYNMLYRMCTLTINLSLHEQVFSTYVHDMKQLFNDCISSIDSEPHYCSDVEIQILSTDESELLHTIHSHKLFICRSPYLDNVFQSGMEESITGVIKFNEIALNGMISVLQYMYTSEIVVQPESCIEVLVASYMFRFPELSAYCRTMITQHLWVDNIIAVIQIAQLYGDNLLVGACVSFITKEHNYNRVLNLPEWKNISQEFKFKVDAIMLQNAKKKLKKAKQK
jgi:hypothetical protein